MSICFIPSPSKNSWLAKPYNAKGTHTSIKRFAKCFTLVRSVWRSYSRKVFVATIFICLITLVNAEGKHSELQSEISSSDTSINVVLASERISPHTEDVPSQDTHVTVEGAMGQTPFQRRLPIGASWIEYKVTRQGEEWSDWQSATCPQENSHTYAALFTLSSTTGYSATWTNGFNYKFAMMKAARSGYKISAESSDKGTGKYLVPGKGVGQLFFRQRILWQEQTHRKCVKEKVGPIDISCGPWSAIEKGHLPIVNRRSFGWRTGIDNMDYSHCKGVFE